MTYTELPSFDTRWLGDSDNRWLVTAADRWGRRHDLPLYEEVTSLAASHILGLHTTPIEISPTPEAGKVFVPLEILWVHHFGDTPYNVGASGVNRNIYVTTQDEWNSDNDGHWFTFLTSGFAADGSLSPDATWRATASTQNIDFTRLTSSPWIVAKTSGQPVTAGNGTATIRFIYTEIDA